MLKKFIPIKIYPDIKNNKKSYNQGVMSGATAVVAPPQLPHMHERDKMVLLALDFDSWSLPRLNTLVAPLPLQ